MLASASRMHVGPQLEEAEQAELSLRRHVYDERSHVTHLSRPGMQIEELAYVPRSEAKQEQGVILQLVLFASFAELEMTLMIEPPTHQAFPVLCAGTP